MDRPDLIVVAVPLMILIGLFTGGIALHVTAARRPGRSHRGRRLTCPDALRRIDATGRKSRPPKTGVHDAAPVEYLYVPCARVCGNAYSVQTRRWVQAVPVVKKTPQWIYYASDSWSRREAVVGPGRVSREAFETGIRHRDRHGYPAGVIPVPGDRHRPGSAGRLFFATRQAAEDYLYRGERERAEPAAPQAPPIKPAPPGPPIKPAPQAPPLKELRRAMADAHPDRGGTTEQFMRAHRRYQTALRAA